MVGNGLIPSDAGAQKVIGAARRALQLDPGSAEAYTSLATTKFRNLWDFAGAEEDYRRALTLNPNYSTAHQWYADFLRSMGRLEESRREIELAYRLDPLSRAATGARCFALVQDRKYEEAIAFTRRQAELDPRLAAPFCASRAYFALGDYENSIAVIESTGDIPFSGFGSVGDLRSAYRRGGWQGLLRKRIETLQQLPEYAAPTEIASSYALLGDKEKAFEWLEKAYRHRTSRLTSFHIDPAFDSLRSDPRFDDLRKRIGLPM
jgi:tetratricopeptide (TPR) repeat protein